MQQEVEAKFLYQDHEEIRAKLKELGARCHQPTSTMRRTLFDFPDRRLQSEGAWVRLRQEPDGSVELMLKQVKSDELGQTFEAPIVVTDYEAAERFVVALGLEVKGTQESKREIWRYGEVEIMLDQWPWAPPFIEIEAKNEVLVRQAAADLALAWSEARFGGVTPVYVAEYDLTADEFVALELSMKFDQPVPASLIKREN